MARKKKNQLPSGNYRVQVYDYTDADGKRHYKSFTAPSKRLAEMDAAKWKEERSERKGGPEDMTVSEAVERYIEIKKNVLSPSTLRGYYGIHRQYLSGNLGDMQVSEVRSKDVQLWVSELAVKLSPKTVRNAYGLLSSSLDMFAPDMQFKVTLPQKEKAELYCPSDEDVKALLEHIRGTELEIAVLFAAFGPLRRGEICALTDRDISGNMVTVSKSMVKGPDGEWYVKQPKTYSGYRELEMPDFVIEKVQGIRGRIIKGTPSQISNRFDRAVRFSHLPHFRFHDLRHYSASIMHAIGVPDQYIMQRGGWASDYVMKSVYRNSIDAESRRQTEKINAHFRSLNSV